MSEGLASAGAAAIATLTGVVIVVVALTVDGLTMWGFTWWMALAAWVFFCAECFRAARTRGDKGGG